MPDDVILITGATGYLGSWVTKKAVDTGKYTVRGTTRNANSSRAKALQEKCPGINLYELDLLNDEGWAEAFAGVSIVIHTASPFNMDPNFDYVTPALEGTKRMLRLAKDARAKVRQFIFTSSLVALNYGDTKLEERMYTEDDWSKFKGDEKTYDASKTFAEREVWKWAKANPDISICTVNPGLIVGAPLISGCTTGTLDIWNMMYEAGYTPPTNLSICTVEDIAEVHINAIDNEISKNHRILCAQIVPTLCAFEQTAEVFNPMGYNFPTAPLPDCVVCFLFRCCCCINPLQMAKNQLYVDWKLDDSLARKLLRKGKHSDFNAACVEMTYQIIEDGLLPKKNGYKSRKN